MKHLVMLAAVALGSTISGFGAAADPVYVNTKGEVISESEIGDYCRPIEALSDGKLMVFSKSRIDLALYEQRLLANGVMMLTSAGRWSKARRVMTANERQVISARKARVRPVRAKRRTPAA